MSPFCHVFFPFILVWPVYFFTSLKTVKLFSNNRVYSPDNWCSLQQWSSGLVETKLVLSELKQNGAAIGLSGLRGNSRGGECRNFIIQSPVPGDTPPQNTVRKNKIRMFHLFIVYKISVTRITTSHCWPLVESGILIFKSVSLHLLETFKCLKQHWLDDLIYQSIYVTDMAFHQVVIFREICFSCL